MRLVKDNDTRESKADCTLWIEEMKMGCAGRCVDDDESDAQSKGLRGCRVAVVQEDDTDDNGGIRENYMNYWYDLLVELLLKGLHVDMGGSCVEDTSSNLEVAQDCGFHRSGGKGVDFGYKTKAQDLGLCKANGWSSQHERITRPSCFF